MTKSPKNVVVSAIVGMVFLLSIIATPSAVQELGYKEMVIAGGTDKFAEVRHVVLKGSNFEIGKRIGAIAKKDGTLITPSNDHIMNRAKREYMPKYSTYISTTERMAPGGAIMASRVGN